MIGSPPSPLGAVHDKVTWESPTTPLSALGAKGTVAGVSGAEGADGADVPAPLRALTVKV